MSRGNSVARNTAVLIAFALSVAAGGARAAEERSLAPLLLQNHCDECHLVNAVRIGPPFIAVASRYSTSSEATLEVLARKIMLGGAGNWGTVPMVPNERLTLEQARDMARWVLSLKAGAP